MQSLPQPLHWIVTVCQGMADTEMNESNKTLFTKTAGHTCIVASVCWPLLLGVCQCQKQAGIWISEELYKKTHFSQTELKTPELFCWNPGVVTIITNYDITARHIQRFLWMFGLPSFPIASWKMGLWVSHLFPPSHPFPTCVSEIHTSSGN